MVCSVRILWQSKRQLEGKPLGRDVGRGFRGVTAVTTGHHEQPGRLHIQAGGDPAEVRRLPAARDPAALEQTLAALAAGWLPRSPGPGRRTHTGICLAWGSVTTPLGSVFISPTEVFEKHSELIQ
ncbi:hypothetical protein ACRRTK_008172 [Alexandromys fortis]